MGCSASAVALVSCKFRSLGLEARESLQALLSDTKIRGKFARGEDIAGLGSATKRLTVLLDGIACSYTRLEDGRRQIYAFHYSGDFCNLHRYVSPEVDVPAAVGALTDCSVGTIDFKDI